MHLCYNRAIMLKGDLQVAGTSRFIEACWGRNHDRVPVWFMRQAGRYQAGYRALRQRYSFLEMAHDPDICTEVSCRPVEELGVDAAILFSDIMIPLGPMGVDFDIQEHRGPVIAQPIRSREDLRTLSALDPERDLPEVFQTVEQIRQRISPVPVIGFCGAPFTLASYLIEGGPSKNYEHTKQLMWEQPDVWQDLMAMLADSMAGHLAAQIRHGASAVQVFDSWVGALAPADYQRSVLPAMQRLFGALKSLGVPTIYFGTGTASLLPLMKQAGSTVLGIDWRTPVDQARSNLGRDITLQGNLDPVTLLSGWETVRSHADGILQEAGRDPRFIFNLGHGVPPGSDPAVLKRLVDYVHAYPHTPGHGA